jgi:hypothetical protein
MGVDTRISLPSNVRVRDVAKVMAASLGCKVTRRIIPRSSGIFAECEDVKIDSASMAELCNIELHNCTVGSESQWFLFHWELSGGKKGMLPRSTAINIAIGMRLIKFFGGSIDFQDCDSTQIDYIADEKSNDENCPTDGREWDNLQKRILAIEPITDTEIQECEKFAAYHHY